MLYNQANYNILLIDDKLEKGMLIENLLNHYKKDDTLCKNTIWYDGNIIHKDFKLEKEKEAIWKEIEDFVENHYEKAKTHQESFTLKIGQMTPIFFEIVKGKDAFLKEIEDFVKNHYEKAKTFQVTITLNAGQADSKGFTFEKDKRRNAFLMKIKKYVGKHYENNKTSQVTISLNASQTDSKNFRIEKDKREEAFLKKIEKYVEKHYENTKTFQVIITLNAGQTDSKFFTIEKDKGKAAFLKKIEDFVENHYEKAKTSQESFTMKVGQIEPKVFNVEKENEAFLKEIGDFANKHPQNTKIFQVTTVKEAVLLLSTGRFGDTLIRFGLIMLDYLLATKQDNPNTREYSSEFFSWLTNNNDSESDTYNLGKTDKELIRSIKGNRSPLQKLWFFPITAFNQTLLDDLRNNGVRLIDYYWHISRGADPINTPILFLYTLNNFLYLQLQQSVYSLRTLTKFLERSIEGICKINDIDEFHSQMGSDYVVLIHKHGWRAVVKKDADSGSSFSKYIWGKFYGLESNEYLFRLMDRMQKFFHICTYGDEYDFEKMMIYLNELDIFICDYWSDLLLEFNDSDKIASSDKKSGNIVIPICDLADDLKKPDLEIFRKKIYLLIKNIK